MAFALWSSAALVWKFTQNPIYFRSLDLRSKSSFPIRMDAEQEIKTAQQNWAGPRGIAFDRDGYVTRIEANLYRPLSDRARLAFEAGAGSELRRHMRALHSSSGLVVNFFDYWTDRDMTPFLPALGIEPDGEMSLDFEVQFHTGLRGTPPHLDVAMTNGNGYVFAIESKFTEHLKRSTRGKSKFSKSYFPVSAGLWTESGLPASQELAESLWAEEIHGGSPRFEYLDPRQLLKHALGLATQLGSGFSLCYLYYDCTGNEAEAHRKEMASFGELVGDEVRLRALTYQQVFAGLMESGQADTEYLSYLEARYFAKSVWGRHALGISHAQEYEGGQWSNL